MVVTTSKILYRTLMGALVLIFLSVMAVIAGLARGPVSLNFLTPYLSQVLEEQYPNLDLSYRNVDLVWNGRDKNLLVALDDVTVARDKMLLATIPDLKLVFSGAALLRGRIAPAALEFTGLRIRLTRALSGELRLGYDYTRGEEAQTAVEVPPVETGERDAVFTILRQLSGAPDPDKITGYLRRMELYNSTVYIEDQVLGRFWRFSNADLFVWRQPNGLRGQANGDFRIGRERVSVVATADYDRTTQKTSIDGQFDDLPLPLVGAQAPELERLTGMKLNLSGRLHVDLDEKFTFDTIDFDLASADAGEIDWPDLYKAPLPVDSLSLSGQVSGDLKQVTIDKAELNSLGVNLHLSGALENGEAGLGLTLEGGLEKLAINNLGRFWPYSLAVHGYDWVTANIRGGTVPAATFKVDIPAGAFESGELPKGAVRLAFDMKGTTTNYFAPLPKVTDIDGSAVLTERGITITGLTGKLGDMAVTSEKVRIYDFDKYDQQADISLHVTGKSRDIFTFLDRKPLGLASPYGIRPGRMTGEGVVDASFKFPLRDDLLLKQVDYRANGHFTDAFVPDVTDGVNLKKGDLDVAVDPDGVKVTGTAALNDVPMKIKAESWFRGKKSGNRRYQLSGTVNDMGRRSLQLETPYLKGPMTADILLETTLKGSATGHLSLGLTETEIDISALHWLKKAGLPGKMTADIRSGADGVTRLSNIALSAGEMTATGEAVLKDKLVTQLKMPSVRYGSNDFGFDFTQKKAGEMTVRVSGKEFDLKPFVVATYDLNKANIDAPEQDRKIDITVRFDQVLLDQDIALNDLQARMMVEGTLITSSIADGHFKGGKKVSFDLARAGTGRKVRFVSDDAGLLFRGLDLYDNARDGKLTLDAEIDDTKAERPAKGSLKITDVRVVNAPVLGKILTVGSLSGIVDLLRGEGIVFANVEGPFTYEDGVITTKDFRAVGSIGITLTGTIDQPANKIDAFGTVIPSYTLNSILGNIPILGTLLVGKKGEGIFGFSYKAKGSLENPDISVNAVSALAPGILRRMFFEPWDQSDVEPPTINDPKRPTP